MNLVLTEEHQLVKQTAAEFVGSRSSLKRIRALRDSNDRDAFSRDLWHEMAGLGWTGIVIPEKYGGSGLGYSHLMVVMEELGRGLMPEPMVPTILGAAALLLGGSDEQRRELLPGVARAETILSLGHLEAGSRFDPYHVETRAERKNGKWRLSGEKRLVPNGQSADRLVVSARTSGTGAERSGLTLFLVDRKASGVGVT